MMSNYLLRVLSQGGVANNIVKIPCIALQLTVGRLLKGIKSNKKIIIFTNLYYNGNPRAVYERFLEHPELLEKYDVYWMTSNIKEFFRLRREKKPVLYKHGLLSVKIYKAADLWVLAHNGPMNLPRIMQDTYEKERKIQLGHGVGPKATKGEGREYKLYEAYCLSSEYIRERHINLWNAPPERLYATGFPRMDTLLRYLKMNRKSLLEDLRIPSSYEKIILYAPTFDLGLWPWGDPYEGIDRLAEFLEKREALLLLRPHPYADYNRRSLRRVVRKHRNLMLIPMSKYPDTQKILAITDVLITDWSSIYTDFLATGRPIVFIEVNEKFFLEERGKPEVPPEMRPGVRVRNEEEFYQNLSKVIEEKYIPDSDFYKQCLHLIHGEVDGRSSDRVIEVIENILVGG